MPIFKPDSSGSAIAAASQAEQETGTSTTVYTSPGRQQFHPSASKSWVLFNGTGTLAVNASYNVTSVADEGAGLYRVNFTTAFSSANYGVGFGIGTEPDSGRFALVGSPSLVAGGFQIRISNAADVANVDSSRISAICFGDHS